MKTVLITGISRGIGLAAARKFLAEGWQVIGTSTSGKTPVTHPCLKIFPLDLSDSLSIQTLASQLPPLDLLINNAAILLESGADVKVDMGLLKKTFAVNVFGTIELTEHCIDKLHKNARIINISSGWGTFSSNNSAGQPQYKMSKTCLNMYTVLLAARLPDMCVSGLDPGWVKTDMGTERAPTHPEQVASEIYNLACTSKKSGYLWSRGHIRDW
ncbi:SDR family NAD(P)-dependent oxidoreductase [Legionella spiritensis]|uniref:SDR family NAD(P)-dependent oxidoreductase n=1 Tax=Legionella spiritensis TaxID=452 RepID=UPI000F6D2949|nr:SDR family NAD(P)-dependent oxidoreductase [Legionella spiritensis]VEG90486.1 oxidoreductase [Legionella spiritensis]